MPHLTILQDLVIIFTAAILVVGSLQRLRVPTIAGFILVGALLGPRSLGLISDIHDVEVLAEVGVVLLLFGIGLELSLDRLRRLWKPILIGGALQVGVTLVLTAAFALFLGLTVGQSIFLGFLTAVSSTAIVLRGLQAKGELESGHGRFVLGILVFQDLCVVPMMLSLPLLAGKGATVSGALTAMVASIGMVVAVLAAARVLVPRVLHAVARTRQRDLFILTVAAICFGTAWAVSSAGVSLALGAFLAGLVVAGSEYRHQALAELVPMREVLTSLFFVSVGMLLDPAALVSRPLVIGGLLAAILIGKFVIVLLVAMWMGLSVRVATMAAMSLCQIGEFAFVLVTAAGGTALVDTGLEQNLMAAMILSMLLAPITLALAPHAAAGVETNQVLNGLLRVRPVADAGHMVDELQGHVILAGLGITGKELVHLLQKLEVPHVVVDLNAESVRRASRDGQKAVFGDVTSPEVLEFLGVHRARWLVLTVNDEAATARAVEAARNLSPELKILVRARFAAEAASLVKAGATEVVTSELTAAVEILTRVLLAHGVESPEHEPYLRRIREARPEQRQ